MPIANTTRSRRSCLAVPGSNPRFVEKAKGLPADQVFLDLEDAVAPLAKPDARKTSLPRSTTEAGATNCVSSG